MKDKSAHKDKRKLPDEIRERNDLKEIIERKNLQNKVLKKMIDEINKTDTKQNNS